MLVEVIEGSGSLKTQLKARIGLSLKEAIKGSLRGAAGEDAGDSAAHGKVLVFVKHYVGKLTRDAASRFHQRNTRRCRYLIPGEQPNDLSGEERFA